MLGAGGGLSPSPNVDPRGAGEHRAVPRPGDAQAGEAATGHSPRRSAVTAPPGRSRAAQPQPPRRASPTARHRLSGSGGLAAPPAPQVLRRQRRGGVTARPRPHRTRPRRQWHADPSEAVAPPPPRAGPPPARTSAPLRPGPGRLSGPGHLRPPQAYLGPQPQGGQEGSLERTRVPRTRCQPGELPLPAANRSSLTPGASAAILRAPAEDTVLSSGKSAHTLVSDQHSGRLGGPAWPQWARRRSWAEH